MGVRGRERQRQRPALAPVRVDQREPRSPLLARRRPLVVGCAGGARERRVERERADPVGAAGGEHHRHRAALDQCQHTGSLGPDRVEHRRRIVDLLLEHRRPAEPVAHPRLTPVVHGQPRPRPDPLEPGRNHGMTPQRVERGERLWYVEQVDRTLADRLECDVTVAVAGVTGLGRHPDDILTDLRIALLPAQNRGPEPVWPLPSWRRPTSRRPSSRWSASSSTSRSSPRPSTTTPPTSTPSRSSSR